MWNPHQCSNSQDRRRLLVWSLWLSWVIEKYGSISKDIISGVRKYCISLSTSKEKAAWNYIQIKLCVF